MDNVDISRITHDLSVLQPYENVVKPAAALTRFLTLQKQRAERCSSFREHGFAATVARVAKTLTERQHKASSQKTQCTIADSPVTGESHDNTEQPLPAVAHRKNDLQRVWSSESSASDPNSEDMQRPPWVRRRWSAWAESPSWRPSKSLRPRRLSLAREDSTQRDTPNAFPTSASSTPSDGDICCNNDLTRKKGFVRRIQANDKAPTDYTRQFSAPLPVLQQHRQAANNDTNQELRKFEGRPCLGPSVTEISKNLNSAKKPKRPAEPMFTKVRRCTFDRSVQRDIEDLNRAWVSPLKQFDTSHAPPAIDRSTSSASFRSCIWSDVETDIEVVSDIGADTDTDCEGRPATRCLVFDPFDGMPHPFWGIDVEQASWVSIPNPAKLDPECKVLHMLRLLKEDVWPLYNSFLFVRHYKPFLKYGMFPHRLFELRHQLPAESDYTRPELQHRAMLCKLEQYPYDFPEKPFSVHPHPEPCQLPQRITSMKATDPVWIQETVNKFHATVLPALYTDRHYLDVLLDLEQRRSDDLQIPCSVDPTWRNVYSSRVHIYTAPRKKRLITSFPRDEESYISQSSSLTLSDNDAAVTSDIEDGIYASMPRVCASSLLSISAAKHSTSQLEKQFLNRARSCSTSVGERTEQGSPQQAERFGKSPTNNKPVFSAISEKPPDDSGVQPLISLPQTLCAVSNEEQFTRDKRQFSSNLDVVSYERANRQRRWSLQHSPAFHRSFSASDVDVSSRRPRCYCRDLKIVKTSDDDENGSPLSPYGYFVVNDTFPAVHIPFMKTKRLMTNRPRFFLQRPKKPQEVSYDGPLASLPASELRRYSHSFLPNLYKQLARTERFDLSQQLAKGTAVAQQWCTARRRRLRMRHGRRYVMDSKELRQEHDAWMRFHQLREVFAHTTSLHGKASQDSAPLGNNKILPPPVPVAACACFPKYSTTANERCTALPWPTFVPTLFRGPARYEDHHEALIHALWKAHLEGYVPPHPRKNHLKLWIGGFMIPHDEKRFRFGDDAWFGSEPLMCLGVCDGVGEMSDTQWRVAGFDCRGFGEDILREGRLEVERVRSANRPLPGRRLRMVLPDGYHRSERVWEYRPFTVDSSSVTPSLLALHALIAGFYNKTTSWGAATCCFACTNDSGSRIGFANIGDSRALILRRSPVPTDGDVEQGNAPLHLVGSTEPEQHGWNLPVQLARLPDLSRLRQMRQDPRLSQLVHALDSCHTTGQDSHDPAESAMLYDFSIQEGDLILLATDGVWDNVFESEVAALCGIALSPRESEWVTGSPFMSTAPRDIAKGICLAAYWKSLQLKTQTPFTLSVPRHELGGCYQGGKPDDITVVAAWVVPQEDENTQDLLTRCQDTYANRCREIEKQQQSHKIHERGDNPVSD